MKWIEIELFPPILSIYFIHVRLSRPSTLSIKKLWNVFFWHVSCTVFKSLLLYVQVMLSEHVNSSKYFYSVSFFWLWLIPCDHKIVTVARGLSHVIKEE